MKAVVWTAYGPPEVLKIQDVPKPVPKDDDILIRVKAAAVTSGDCEVRSLKIALGLGLAMRMYTGVWKPSRVRILGSEFAGIVEEVGKNVTRFKPGDEVYASSDERFGAYAEYACIPANSTVARKPANMSWEEASGVPISGLNALHFVRHAQLLPGQKVLMYGATGSIGHYAVQIAAQYDVEITVVCLEKHFDLVKSLGAHHVMDYTKEDFSAAGAQYDVVFDPIGKSGYARSIRALKDGGRYVIGNPSVGDVVRMVWTNLATSKKVSIKLADENAADLDFMATEIEAGRVRSVMDSVYSMEEIVDAHRYVDAKQKTGNVAVRIAEE